MTIAEPRPRTGEPVTAATEAAQKAPISILPSREMSMMPARSEKMPAIAHRIRGVATRNVASMVRTNCNHKSAMSLSLRICAFICSSKAHQ